MWQRCMLEWLAVAIQNVVTINRRPSLTFKMSLIWPAISIKPVKQSVSHSTAHEWENCDVSVCVWVCAHCGFHPSWVGVNASGVHWFCGLFAQVFTERRIREKVVTLRATSYCRMRTKQAISWMPTYLSA